MKKTNLITLFIFIVFSACTFENSSESNTLTSYVNPFVGTGGHWHTLGVILLKTPFIKTRGNFYSVRATLGSLEVKLQRGNQAHTQEGKTYGQWELFFAALHRRMIAKLRIVYACWRKLMQIPDSCTSLFIRTTHLILAAHGLHGQTPFLENLLSKFTTNALGF